MRKYKEEKYKHAPRWECEFDERNGKGERIVCWLTKCDGGKIQQSWFEHGDTNVFMETWWSVAVYVYTTDGRCYGDYNPQVKRTTNPAQMDFEWVLEATEENKIKILEEVSKRAFNE